VTLSACDATYERPTVTRPRILHCTYPRGHENRAGQPAEHSWWSIQCADLSEAAAAKIDYTPQAVQAFLDSITRGEMDLYLEAVLAVAHNRKRARHGTAGFRDRSNP
jgi:hypothetical protein